MTDYLTSEDRYNLLRSIDTARRAGLVQSDSIRDSVAREVERIIRRHQAEALRLARERLESLEADYSNSGHSLGIAGAYHVLDVGIEEAGDE